MLLLQWQQQKENVSYESTGVQMVGQVNLVKQAGMKASFEDPKLEAHSPKGSSKAPSMKWTTTTTISISLYIVLKPNPV